MAQETMTLEPVVEISDPIRELKQRIERLVTDMEDRKVTFKAATHELRGMLDEIDPLAKARHAGEALVKEMQEAEGGAWSGAELAEKFGLRPAALHKRRKEHRIVFWRDARHDFHYPKWQFTPNGALLPGIQEVLQTFRSPDEWRVMRYFLGKRDQLSRRRPLDLLREGDVSKVVAHAEAHARENTW